MNNTEISSVKLHILWRQSTALHSETCNIQMKCSRHAQFEDHNTFFMDLNSFPGCLKPCNLCLLVLFQLHEAFQIGIYCKLQVNTLFSHFSDQQRCFHQQQTSRKKQVKLTQLSQ